MIENKPSAPRSHTPSDMPSEISVAARKDAHLDLAKKAVPSDDMPHPLDAITLPYCALPEANLSSINITTCWLGKQLKAPLMITGMTGGTSRARSLNQLLAAAANKHGIALGIGSQRASLQAGESQAELRRIAPDIPLIGNIGGAQLAAEGGLGLAQRAIDDIQADALAIHINPLQEAIQPEGDHDWRGVRAAILAAKQTLSCPILVKEVGAGLSIDVVDMLASDGIEMMDVAGKGGTNWAAVEAARRTPNTAQLYEPFLDMGIDLPDAIHGARQVSDQLFIIASGGIRHGMDASRCLWLGADIAGIAGRALRALEDENGTFHEGRLDDYLSDFIQQIKLSLFLTGNQSIANFKKMARICQENSD